jgi:PAS domain S-box-containing protein
MTARSDARAGEAAAPLARIRDLESRLREAEETLRAIRRGWVDAIIVDDAAGGQLVYTLDSADRPYRTLIEQMQEGALTLGEDGLILYCNRRLADMLGVAQEHLIGQGLQAFLHDTGAAALQRMLREAAHGVARAELAIPRADGGSIPIYLSLSVLPRDGDMPLLCGVVTDLSEQKHHLRELEAANARLLEEMAERAKVDEALKHLQKMEAIGKLAAGVAHDFNNILQSIVGCLEMVLDELAEGTPGRRFAGVALNAATRGSSLTHHLLSYARRQVLLPRVVALAPFLADLRTLLGRTLGPNIAIQTRVDATRGVLVDPGQLETALLNLAINASHAMRHGGTLAIEASDARDGPFVVIAVTDTGIGMDAATLAQAVEPFFTTKGAEGTGLGLPMVQGFVEQSGGTFSIDSAPGRGTTIRLRLPSGAPDRA